MRDANHTAREAKLALWQEELIMQCKEKTTQVAAADTEQGEFFPTADDERHANGDDAKHWWIQSAAKDGHRWDLSPPEDGNLRKQ